MTGNAYKHFKEATLRGGVEKQAFGLLFEWRSAEGFRPREKWRQVWPNTHTWAVRLELEEKHGVGWSSHEDGRLLLDFWRRVTQAWLEKGWVRLETVSQGRPRSEGPAAPTLEKARRRSASLPSWADKPEWVSRLLWEDRQQSTEWLVVADEKLFDEVTKLLPPDELEGTTREELAQALDCSSKLAKALVRHLVETGEWKVTHNGKTGRRELRRAVK